jgi:Kelch motif protein
MPGTWSQVGSICASRRLLAYAECNRWADEGYASCSSWADEGSNQCKQWADEGSNQCCDWAPCSWFCDAFYWVAKWVCLGWYWVAKWVCLAWYWVAKWVCKAWYWIAHWVCLAWTWIFYVFCSNADGGPLFQLTDGTVLMNECANGYGTHRWWKLTPDSTGSYANGVWTRMADSANGRKYFASAVLADGRLLVCGGEYSDLSGSNANDDTAAGEIYDPVANSWSPLSPPAGITQIGDSPGVMLADGRFLIGSFNSASTFLFDPATATWTAAGTNGAKGDSGSEESWVLMADGTVVTPQCGSPPNAEMYIVSGDKWQPDGATVSTIVETSSSETGPAFLLTDGRAFFVGATNQTALYQSGATDTAVGTWSAGPQIPNNGRQQQGAKDGPGVLLPSGNVLFPVAPVDGIRKNYNSPCSFFEFDGTNLNRVSDPPNANCPTFVGRMLILPSGQAMWVREDDDSFYVYTETGQAQNSFRPVITSAPNIINPGTTINVSGTQFNGLSQAVGYGDDYAAATNYPLVRIRNHSSGTVRYCHTANHTTGGAPSMGVATGAATVTTEVSLPGDLELGASDLIVVANGIPSDPVTVDVQPEGRGHKKDG